MGQRSDPTATEDTPSWFYRLRVENNGMLPAKDCVGRLIAICAGDKVLSNIDPMTLYWARQNKHNQWQPVTIQGRRDYVYLDIAQFRKGRNASDDALFLRIDVPDDERLVQDDFIEQHPHKQPEQHTGEPVKTEPTPIELLKRDVDYYFLIGIFSDSSAHDRPTWYKFEYRGKENEPYSLRKCQDHEKPQSAKSRAYQLGLRIRRYMRRIGGR
jgi:hypothetical protein